MFLLLHPIMCDFVYFNKTSLFHLCNHLELTLFMRWGPFVYVFLFISIGGSLAVHYLCAFHTLYL